MSSFRDVVARMAIDTEFAHHARTYPDAVGVEYGLSATETARLRELSDARAADGPTALGARLSKSGIGTGGLGSLFGNTLPAPDPGTGGGMTVDPGLVHGVDPGLLQGLHPVTTEPGLVHQIDPGLLTGLHPVVVTDPGHGPVIIPPGLVHGIDPGLLTGVHPIIVTDPVHPGTGDGTGGTGTGTTGTGHSGTGSTGSGHSGSGHSGSGHSGTVHSTGNQSSTHTATPTTPATPATSHAQPAVTPDNVGAAAVVATPTDDSATIVEGVAVALGAALVVGGAVGGGVALGRKTGKPGTPAVPPQGNLPAANNGWPNQA